MVRQDYSICNKNTWPFPPLIVHHVTKTCHYVYNEAYRQKRQSGGCSRIAQRDRGPLPSRASGRVFTPLPRHTPGLQAQSPMGMSHALFAQANQFQELWRGSGPPKRCLPNTDGRCGSAAPSKPTTDAFCWASWPPCLPWVVKRTQQSWQNGYHQSCSGKAEERPE